VKMTAEEYRAVAHRIATRRTKGTPHGDLIKAVVARLVLVPGVEVIQMNTGALRAVGQGGRERLVRYGYPGMADLYVRARSGHVHRTCWLECKVPPDKQSPAQVAFEQMAQRWGDTYVVVRSVEDALRAVGATDDSA